MLVWQVDRDRHFVFHFLILLATLQCASIRFPSALQPSDDNATE